MMQDVISRQVNITMSMEVQRAITDGLLEGFDPALFESVMDNIDGGGDTGSDDDSDDDRDVPGQILLDEDEELIDPLLPDDEDE